MYDLIILGGGPAGVAAGVYAARKRLKTLLLTESFGGQSVDSLGIENWVGTTNISGPDLAKALETHLRAQVNKPDSTLEYKLEHIDTLEKSGDHFRVRANSDTFEARTVLVATGSSRRKLDVPGAKEYENKGITYCASCDGPLFAGQDVAVIGGGNAGFESAAQLLAYCRSVTLLNRSDSFRADEQTVEAVLKHPAMKVIRNATPKEVKGDKFVTGLAYTDAASGTDHELAVTGIFVEIGLIPATGFVSNVLTLNEFKQIPTDPKTQRTAVEGIWAAGDCTDGLYHQNNIAAGDAVRALEDIYMYIKTGK